MKNETRQFTRLAIRAIWGALMDCGRLLVASAFDFAQEQPKIPTFAHNDGSGKPDPGVTTPSPKGSTITKYKDGWSKTIEPDNSTGKLERKETVKDPNGKIHEIVRRDIKTGEQTYRFIIVDDAGGGKTTYTDIGKVQTKVVEKPKIGRASCRERV